MTKLFYHPSYQTLAGTHSEDQTDLNHPLHIPEYYIKPVSYIEYAKKEHKDHSYWKCPAWQHYWGNTYVVFNQLDISFKWQKKDGLIYESSFDRHKHLDYIHIQEGTIGTYNTSEFSQGNKSYAYKDYLVIQWAQSLMVWPQKQNKNLWVEMVPFPTLHHQTGMELITAEFPFGRWYRSINGAYRCWSEDVNVPRGTPLYCLRFRGGKDNLYKMERSPSIKPPKEVRRLFRLNHAVKSWLPFKSWNLIKDDVEEKKCPFNFLFK